MFAAFLDTCALYPATRRDFLLSLAVEGIYRPLWSGEILAELQQNEERKLREMSSWSGIEPEEAAWRAGRLVINMEEAFPDAQVSRWEPLEGTFGLPDHDDEHVLAAAVIGGAGAIVTDNVKDFPGNLTPSQIAIITCKDFALNQVEQNPTKALAAVQSMAGRNRREPNSVAAILDVLDSRYGMSAVVEVIREAAGQ